MEKKNYFVTTSCEHGKTMLEDIPKIAVSTPQVNKPCGKIIPQWIEQTLMTVL